VAAVFILATLDTKGREAAYVRDLLTSWQIPVVLVDVGAIGDPAVAPDISRERIFELAGTSLEAIRQQSDRGEEVGHPAKPAPTAGATQRNPYFAAGAGEDPGDAGFCCAGGAGISAFSADGAWPVGEEK